MADAYYRIFIPDWHPPRKNVYNRGATYQARAARRRVMRLHTARMVDAYMHAYKVPKADGKRRIQITVVMGKGKRAGDPDGYQECINDAMQDAGLILNDNHHKSEILQPKIDRAQGNATLIEVWELEREKDVPRT